MFKIFQRFIACLLISSFLLPDVARCADRNDEDNPSQLSQPFSSPQPSGSSVFSVFLSQGSGSQNPLSKYDVVDDNELVQAAHPATAFVSVRVQGDVPEGSLMPPSLTLSQCISHCQETLTNLTGTLLTLEEHKLGLEADIDRYKPQEEEEEEEALHEPKAAPLLAAIQISLPHDSESKRCSEDDSDQERDDISSSTALEVAPKLTHEQQLLIKLKRELADTTKKIDKSINKKRNITEELEKFTTAQQVGKKIFEDMYWKPSWKQKLLSLFFGILIGSGGGVGSYYGFEGVMENALNVTHSSGEVVLPEIMGTAYAVEATIIFSAMLVAMINRCQKPGFDDETLFVKMPLCYRLGGWFTNGLMGVGAYVTSALFLFSMKQIPEVSSVPPWLIGGFLVQLMTRALEHIIPVIDETLINWRQKPSGGKIDIRLAHIFHYDAAARDADDPFKEKEKVKIDRQKTKSKKKDEEQLDEQKEEIEKKNEELLDEQAIEAIRALVKDGDVIGEKLLKNIRTVCSPKKVEEAQETSTWRLCALGGAYFLALLSPLGTGPTAYNAFTSFVADDEDHASLVSIAVVLSAIMSTSFLLFVAFGAKRALEDKHSTAILTSCCFSVTSHANSLFFAGLEAFFVGYLFFPRQASDETNLPYALRVATFTPLILFAITSFRSALGAVRAVRTGLNNLLGKAPSPGHLMDGLIKSGRTVFVHLTPEAAQRLDPDTKPFKLTKKMPPPPKTKAKSVLRVPFLRPLSLSDEEDPGIQLVHSVHSSQERVVVSHGHSRDDASSVAYIAMERGDHRSQISDSECKHSPASSDSGRNRRNAVSEKKDAISGSYNYTAADLAPVGALEPQSQSKGCWGCLSRFSSRVGRLGSKLAGCFSCCKRNRDPFAGHSDESLGDSIDSSGATIGVPATPPNWDADVSAAESEHEDD